MKTLHLDIKTRSPLMLASGQQVSNVAEGLTHIPGNTILGLLAARYREQGGDPGDALFKRLFVDPGGPFFGFARIEGAEPIPLSARSCKYFPGLATTGDEHGAVDLLLAPTAEIRCRRQGCEHPLDYLEGEYDPAGPRKTRVKQRLIVRTGISDRRGTAEQGLLYAQRTVEEGQCFICRIDVPDDLAAALEKLVSKEFEACLGTGRSRGQGWVTVGRSDAGGRQWGGARERFASYQRGQDGEGKGRPLLALTLLSDALFTDRFLRDALHPSADDLRALQLDPDEWEPKPVNVFNDARLTGGFDGEPLHLPRMRRTAVKAGSVYLYQANPGVTEPKIPAGDGTGWIGDNNREGYGRTVLWHPFHTEYRPPGEEEA